ncbi:MAG: TIGR02530 family flagellar biosynthesis protein [Lachnospiraceae bacterium]|nr:TIGR02530 family flagellar biosynthesis protein [Lachnospiraceae bacterium]
MNINNKQFLSIEQLQDQFLTQQKSRPIIEAAEGLSFEEILQKTQKKGEVHFSKHAANRLSDRNIELTEEQLERLKDGTKKAGDKGIKESLVLIDELAFIVNTKSNTVITAFVQGETKENIFTNIDGAVIT